MGMDYRYLLFFERDARLDVLERLAETAAVEPDRETLLVLPDRVATLPFSGWIDTPSRLSWDDPSPTWDFMTVLCFEPDESIEYYLDRLHRRVDGDGPDDEPGGRHDAQGRAMVGIVYLTVHNDMTDWPSETDDDLVLFDFNTPGSSMSVLFTESESIRRTFTHLLETSRGVYGLLDLEDSAELFWLRGEAMSEWLPTADLPLAEIERLVRRED